MRRLTALAITALAAALAITSNSPANAGGGCHSEVFNDEATTQVQLTRNCFSPTVVRVAEGDTVTFTNSDPDIHTVTGVVNTWGDDKNIRAGEFVTYQFDESGVFPYFCYLHPSMVGAVVVGDGSAATTDPRADGIVKAVSAGLPAGEITAGGPSQVAEEDGTGLRTVLIVIGVGLLAAVSGFAGAIVWRRRTADDSELP
jgi:plastocyanin